MKILEKDAHDSPPVASSTSHTASAQTAPTENPLDVGATQAVTFRLIMRKGLIALIICAFMLGLAEMACRFVVVLAKPTEAHVREFDHKFTIARKKPATTLPQVLFLGDSYTSRAVYPELLMSGLKAQDLPIEARNLASTSNTPKMSLFFLKTAIKAGWRPNLVVYGLAPRLFNHAYLQHGEESSQAQFEDSYIGRCQFRKPHGWDQWECQLGKSFFLVRYRKYLAEQFKQFSDMITHPDRYLQEGGVGKAVYEISPAGWSPGYMIYTPEDYSKKMAINGKDGPHNIATAEKLFGHYQWDDHMFKELQAYCEHSKIPLLLIWYPENAIREPYYRYYHLSQTGFSARFAQLTHPGKSWFVDFHDADPDARHFYNTDHLNVLGALQMTEKLTQLLTQEPFRHQLYPAQAGSAAEQHQP